MDKVTCLIVDDEPIARAILQTYCSHLAILEVVGSCSSALAAKDALLQHKVDLVFLDINMPILDGIAFLRTLKRPPQVIFTTAYKEYAVDAFELSACDYLVKPFSLERFIVAVDKAIDHLQARGGAPAILSKDQPDDYLFIKSDSKIYKVLHHNLLFAEAQGNNTRLVTQQQILTPAMTFSSLVSLLPDWLFLQVHRSYIVNKSKITHLEGNRVFIDKTEIPIGSHYKEDFLRRLKLY